MRERRGSLCGLLVIGILAIGFATSAGAGLHQSSDGDGIPDHMDNCMWVANAAPMDCDSDGYGNVCDGDFDNNNLTTAGDFSWFFIPDFTGNGLDGGSGTDMDCNGLVTSGDFSTYFIPQFTTSGVPGPSGLSCAGTMYCQ